MENNIVLTQNNIPELIKSVSHNIIPQELRPFVKPALEGFRNEMAAELGIDNYDIIDKGELPSRMNGDVGGSMTRKMVMFAEAVLAWNHRKNLALKNENSNTQEHDGRPAITQK